MSGFVESDPALIELRKWVKEHLGLSYQDGKSALFRERASEICDRFNVVDFQTLLETVRSDAIPGLRLHLADVLSVNHTTFFRESGVLGFFEKEIVPNLADLSSSRIWCGAVSSGEEAYTAAMIVLRRLGSRYRERVHILGTDISQSSIRRAERGVYPQNRVDDMAAEYRQRYMVPMGLGMSQVSSELQEMCTFRRLNLMLKPWPFTREFEVVFLRNVLYYFDTSIQEEIVNRVWEQTAMGGYMLTSVSESLRAHTHRWHYLQPGVYRKLDREPS